MFDVGVKLLAPNGDQASANIRTAVSGLRLTDDGMLQIIGTELADRVRVERRGANLVVSTRMPERPYGRVQLPASQVHQIVVYACEGDDRVYIHRTITVASAVFGGSGNDLLRTGRGNDVIEGGNTDPDSDVDTDDAEALAAALVDAPMTPTDALRADVNRDDDVNGIDIQAFIDAIAP